jgi:hypothetical protein
VFLFAHLGIGVRSIRWIEGLSRKGTRALLPIAPLFLGTLLPDLIDKPLYYGLSWLTGLRGAELGVIAGTRSFGHSWILLLLLTIFLSASTSPTPADSKPGIALWRLVAPEFRLAR